MKKLIIAPLLLAALFAISSGTRVTPAAAAPTAPEIGGCRWFCDGNPTAFKTRNDCQAVCSGFCEAIC
jgi:hypothetical protein